MLTPAARPKLPGGVWALGVTSMLMDLSSELVHSLLPIFMTTVLGASIGVLGAVEGIAESLALITKIFSGTLSDYWGRRKPIALFGYGLAALTKPVFPLASSVALVAGAQFVDRIGKGIRGAPRDALVADLTHADHRGAAFGLRQSLDSLGSLAGPGAALALMWMFHNDVRSVLWFAPIPAAIAVVVLIFAVKEPAASPGRAKPEMLRWKSLSRLGPGFWGIVILGGVFTLARFSEAFLVLRAQNSGLSIGWIPLVLVVMNTTYMLVAYPAGIAADRGHQKILLLSGLAVLIAADTVLATAPSPELVLAGAALWGIHMALTQGLLAKLVADTTPPVLRGTGFGIFNLVAGISTLFASLIAGLLWSNAGPFYTFAAGAVFSGIAFLGVLFQKRD
ncbi:MAG: MFS transporter [Acidobacteriota bacterium]